MLKIIYFTSFAINIALLIIGPIIIDDCYCASYEEVVIPLTIAAPASVLLLLYLTLKENALEYMKVTLLRRRLEGERKIHEEQKRIKELRSGDVDK